MDRWRRNGLADWCRLIRVGGCALLVALVMTAAVQGQASASDAAAKPEYKLAARWGEAGTGTGQFGEPHGLNFDRDGNLLITDYELSRVYRFTPEGKFLGELNAEPGIFYEPRDVVVDREGNTFVSNGEPGRIQRFDPEGKLVATWGHEEGPGKLGLPHSMAFGPDNRLYVADPYDGHVKVYDTEGRFLFQWGSRGTEPGQFISPHGIAADREGNIFVCEYEGARCQKFTSEGKHLLTFAAAPAGVRRIYHSVTCDKEGNVYLTARDRTEAGVVCVIAKYGNQGEFIADIAPPRDEDHPFAPNCAVVDEQGRVYVANAAKGAVGIEVFAPVK